jgi:hypothetical protein
MKDNDKVVYEDEYGVHVLGKLNRMKVTICQEKDAFIIRPARYCKVIVATTTGDGTVVKIVEDEP